MGPNNMKHVVWALCESSLFEFGFLILIEILFYIQVVTYEIHELGVPWSRLRIEMGPNDVKRIVWALCESLFYLIRFFDTNSHLILYTGCNLQNTRAGSAMESVEDRNGP